MSYATLADLTTRYGEEEIRQRSDHAGTGVTDPAVVAQALADASAEIDAYLAGRYVLPLPTVPPHLVRIACAIARYRLWDEAVPDRVRIEYEDARRLLEALARGTVTLGLPANLPPDQQPGRGLAAAQSGPGPVFGRDATGGY